MLFFQEILSSLGFHQSSPFCIPSPNAYLYAGPFSFKKEKASQLLPSHSPHLVLWRFLKMENMLTAHLLPPTNASKHSNLCPHSNETSHKDTFDLITKSSWHCSILHGLPVSSLKLGPLLSSLISLSALHLSLSSALSLHPRWLNFLPVPVGNIMVLFSGISLFSHVNPSVVAWYLHQSQGFLGCRKYKIVKHDGVLRKLRQDC